MSKTHFKKMRNPNFLGSWDLFDKDGNKQEINVTIVKVDKTKVTNPKNETEELMTVHLKGVKPLICNSTNAKMIASLTGSPFIEDWQGVTITLYIASVFAFGETHDAIRIRKTLPNIKKVKEKLTPEHKSWESAKDAIKAGTVKIEDVQKKYEISAADLKTLTT